VKRRGSETLRATGSCLRKKRKREIKGGRNWGEGTTMHSEKGHEGAARIKGLPEIKDGMRKRGLGRIHQKTKKRDGKKIEFESL